MPSLDEIRAMGIVEARKLDKEVILKAAYEGETYTANDYRFEDEHHNPIDQGWEVRLRIDDSLMSKHRVTWTYHDPKVGNVDEIKTEESYEDDSPKSVLITRQDKEGKEQPAIIERKVFAKPIAEPIEEIITK